MDLSAEGSSLSARLAEAVSSQNTLKFKVQSLEQELELIRRNEEWAKAELAKATEAAASHRSKRTSEVVQLQAALDEATSELSAASGKASQLESALSSTTLRLNERTEEVEQLKTRLASQEAAFADESATQAKLHELLQKRAEDAQAREHQADEKWRAALQQVEQGQAELREEIALERKERERVEQEKVDLQLALDRLAESVGIETDPTNRSIDEDRAAIRGGSRASTPHISNVGLNTSLIMSPTAALAGKLQRSGKSFTEIYTELARTQEELRREKLETQRLGQVLETVFEDLRVRQPVLQAQREETERLRDDLQEMSERVAQMCEQKDHSERARQQLQREAQRLRTEYDIASRNLADLAQQVRTLTREIAIRDDPSAADRLDDDGSSLPDPAAGGEVAGDETQAVISAQLVSFHSLTELVAQNQRLLRVTRELGSRMEAKEREYRTALQENENEAVQQATEVIEQLNEDLRAEKSRAEGLVRERDMFRGMVQSRSASSGAANGLNGHSNGASAGGANAGDSAMAQSLANQYSQLQAHFDAYRTESRKDADMLKQDVNDARQAASQAAVQAAREKASREATEGKSHLFQRDVYLMLITTSLQTGCARCSRRSKCRRARPCNCKRVSARCARTWPSRRCRPARTRRTCKRRARSSNACAPKPPTRRRSATWPRATSAV